MAEAIRTLPGKWVKNHREREGDKIFRERSEREKVLPNKILSGFSGFKNQDLLVKPRLFPPK